MLRCQGSKSTSSSLPPPCPVKLERTSTLPEIFQDSSKTQVTILDDVLERMILSHSPPKARPHANGAASLIANEKSVLLHVATRTTSLTRSRQLERGMVASILCLLGASIATFAFGRATVHLFVGSYDGFKEAHALDENHWLLTDDGRGIVFAATLDRRKSSAELNVLLSGLSAPNGLAVDSTRKCAYIADSGTLQLHKIQFCSTEGPTFLHGDSKSSCIEVSSVDIGILNPSLRSPKKGLMHPNGQVLLLADQSSNAIYLVSNMSSWPNISIVALTEDQTLTKPHGMAFLESDNSTANFIVPPQGKAVMPLSV